MILHRKTIDGLTNSTTSFDLSELDSLGLSQYLADFNIEISGNDAPVSVQAKGSFPDSAMQDIADADFPIGGGKKSVFGAALAEMEFTTTGSAYKIMVTRQIASV